MMKKSIIPFLFLCLPCGIGAQVRQYLLPASVSEVSRPVRLLNDGWKFRFSEKDSWERIKVPGELCMQGYGIQYDSLYTYQRDLEIPKNFAGKTVILRFNGVYSYARLFLDDRLIAEHRGGFTRWERDITAYVKPGKKHRLRLDVCDELQDISYASGYAHHPIGGILRDVVLYALPKTHICNLMLDTRFHTDFSSSELRVRYELNEAAKIRYRLTAPDGKEVPLRQPEVQAAAGVQEQCFEVSHPVLWDAEHPNLYQLQLTIDSEQGSYTVKREIGFRKIEIQGDKMLVNGKQVKLRGACRHDMHPTLGRSTNRELDSLDALRFKQANMNFVRTSHYPPSEDFLEFCNRLGIYVECETALCFVDTYRQKNYAPGKTQDDTTYTRRYLQQLEEMVYSFQAHPSVLFWSIGNESVYGTNFQKSYDWVKATDTTRPVIFSYPGTAPKDKKVYDILSMHYPEYTGNCNQIGKSTRGFQGEGIPALFDEWAHVPCYTYTTLQDDPGIREFWAISLDKMWEKLFDAPGGLGGAIWGYSDETFMVPEPRKGNSYWIEFARTAKPKDYQGNCVGYGEWGIVDVWRREKPEFWSTKKAYSPVRLLEKEVRDVRSGQDLHFRIYNRFDHTNLKELNIKVDCNGRTYSVEAPDVAPHSLGILTLGGIDWNGASDLTVRFYHEKGLLIDEERITLATPETEQKSVAKAEPLQIVEQNDFLIVKGAHFEIPFNRQTGLMEGVSSNGREVIQKGPFLNLDLNTSHKTGAEVREKASNYIVQDQDWKLEQMTYEERNGSVIVRLKGQYLKIGMCLNIHIDPQGTLYMDYVTENEPNGWLREAGLKFYLSDSMDRLSWKRKGYWTTYPENSMSGNEGSCGLYDSPKVAYGEQPKQPWSKDRYNYFYFADAGANSQKPLTNSAKAMKENVYEYRVTPKRDKAAVTVLSEKGEVACRMNRKSDEQLILYVNNRWDYPEIAWGDYCKAIDVTPVYGKIKIQL